MTGLAADVAANLAAIRQRVGERVEIVGVTKGFGVEVVRAASVAGLRSIGENYAQELSAKAPAAKDAGLAVHFIGQLQSNKVRQLAGTVDVWETLDRPRLVSEIAKRAPGAVVLLQVDTTGEPGKGGCPVADVPALLGTAQDAGLVVDGLMTVGPTTGGPEAARPGFRLVRRLADDLGLATCSMGMSADLEVAVEEGSTRVRIGTALFGPRPPR